MTAISYHYKFTVSTNLSFYCSGGQKSEMSFSDTKLHMPPVVCCWDCGRELPASHFPYTKPTGWHLQNSAAFLFTYFCDPPML